MDILCSCGSGQYMEIKEIGFEVEVRPNNYRHGDIYKCQNCGNTVLTDFGAYYTKPDPKI